MGLRTNKTLSVAKGSAARLSAESENVRLGACM